MNTYLDVEKSVIISSPAGSGKTEKLARRYICLLEAGSEVERILCITFTEKAAAEMKQRILGILRGENAALHEAIRKRIPLMRISTMHAFCLRLLKRFAMELDIDPASGVMEELEARSLWIESVYDALRAEEGGNGSPFFSEIAARGLRGWGSLLKVLDGLHRKRPLVELSGQGGAGPLGLYRECLKRYGMKKARRRALDFDDLEALAYDALSRGPQWHNILYCFDEHTDHILVDEFQDTNTVQWRIIEKLTEEWRSGQGAKRESGKTPTIFLVGDEKQSIYLFRGANASVFGQAKEKLTEWLGGECLFFQATENYRSLPAIVDFTNGLFERLMGEGSEIGYRPFKAERKGEGAVEMVLLEGLDPRGKHTLTRERRLKEADALAIRIEALHGRGMISDGQSVRPCRYEDMAVLLRTRTHLRLFEEALRGRGIPFVVLKGEGFYEEPETALLRELVSFLVDPMDDYSLFCVLRSPLFSVGYKGLARLKDKRPLPLFEALKADGKFAAESRLLGRWLEALEAGQGLEELKVPVALSRLLERVLTETGGWALFHERQRHANVRKFISLVESFESAGLSPIEIREKLLRHKDAPSVPKANVNAEGMDAVRVMTVHAAKGLQFPMVFLPSLDEDITHKTGPVVVDEEGGEITICVRDESGEKPVGGAFERRKKKELEEEKRLFYVAVTRARDYLCMLGHTPPAKTSRLGYIVDALGIEGGGGGLFKVLGEPELEGQRPSGAKTAPERPFLKEPSYADALSYAPALRWLDVTEDTDAGTRHGEDMLLVGRLMHRLFEELSKGLLAPEDVGRRAGALFGAEGRAERAGIALEQVERLKSAGLMDVVLPAKDSHSELPFVLEKDGRVFKGRMDRLIIKDGTAMVYDYKTFPVKDSEIAGLIEKYRFQIGIYREAAERLFSLKSRGFVLFTEAPKLIEI